MRVSKYTSLSLFEWAEKMGVSAWEMAQIGAGFPKPSSRQCPHVFYQHPWQKDIISREEIANCIAQAEERLAFYLGYWPAPRFIANEKVKFPRPAQNYMYGGGGTQRGQRKAVDLMWGYVQGAGILARTLIGTANANLSDSDNDNVDDVFTVVRPTTVTNFEEIGIYFVPGDRNNAPVDETWRIRPVNVSIAGGNATVIGHPAQLVLPNLTTVTDPQALNVAGAIYATQVEVYRVYRDSTYSTATPYQGTAEWETDGCDTPPCEMLSLPVCIGSRHTDLGQVTVDYNLGGTQWPPDREPDRVKVNYEAGYPRAYGGRMADELANLVAILAASLLPGGTCSCGRAEQKINEYRTLPSEELTGRQMTRMLTWNEIDQSPFGQTRGGIEVWRRAFYLRLGQAALA